MTLRVRSSITSVLVAVVLAAAACGSSSSKAKTTLSNSSSGATTTIGSSGASTTTAAVAPGSTSPTSPTLITPLCGILDAGTIAHVMGSTLSCQEFAAEGTAGRCLWGKLTTGATVQLTAFTGSDFATRKVGWNVAFPKVPGAGQGAWSRGPLDIAGRNNVVLYVDYGSFGLELAVTAAGATTAMAVQLANAIK